MTPSRDDVLVTEAIVQALTPLDIQVLDHVMVRIDQWHSFKQAEIW